MKKILICLVISLLLLTSCFSATALNKAETQLYSSRAGYHITLPADWQLISEDEQSAVFAAPEHDISLTIVSELGGETYYSLREIADMLLEELPGSNSPWQIRRTATDTAKKLRLLVRGEDETGIEVELDLSILQPYPGIRYYLLFAAGRTTAARQSAMIADIGKSFSVDEDISYLYALMEEWRAN